MSEAISGFCPSDRYHGHNLEEEWAERAADFLKHKLRDARLPISSWQNAFDGMASRTKRRPLFEPGATLCQVIDTRLNLPAYDNSNMNGFTVALIRSAIPS